MVQKHKSALNRYHGNEEYRIGGVVMDSFKGRGILKEV